MTTAEALGTIAADTSDARARGRRARRLLMLARTNPLGTLGLVLIIGMILCALLAPYVAPYAPDEIGAGGKLEDPSWTHPFGTDRAGQDMLSRVLFGARISLLVGFFSVTFGTVAGTTIGIVSGYTGGRIDATIQRTADLAIAFPQLLLLIILRQVMGPSVQTLIVAIGLAIIPGVTRVVRGAVLAERNNQYVEAAIVLGATTPRILFIHLLPNVVALSIIVMTSLLGTAVLAEAALSFLGLGIPSAVTWGGDVNDARNTFPVHVWWAFFPGAAITLTVLGFSLLGDSLRDILDPRLRGRR